MRSQALALVALLALAGLAGCLGAQAEPSERRFEATGGKVSPGWAYDGQGIVPGNARLDGFLDDADNAGIVNVTFEYGGASYSVVFDRFAQAEGKEFMDGGVAFGLDEHGDSGVADASIPKIHAVAAAWGKATVLAGGAPLTADPWSAHLMISRDTVRGADGRILDAAGAAPYDPAKPGDATRVEDDAQVLFWIKHPQGETFARAPLNASVPLSFSGPTQTQMVDIPAEKGAAGGIVNFTLRPGQAPVAVGQFAFRLVNASGGVLYEESDPIAQNQPRVGSVELTAAMIDGPLQAQVEGAGAFDVVVDYQVTYEDRPFLVVTWDEVALS